MTRKAAVRVKVVTGACTLFATFQMRCPLCGITVPAGTQHACVKEEAAK